VPGIGVTDCAQFLVVTTNEGCTGTDSGGGAADAEIQLQAQLHHGVGLVDFFVSKLLLPDFLKRPPGGINNAVIFFQAASHVEHAEYHPAAVRAQKMVQISTHSLTGDHSRDVGA
jgi:hypothetical protein